jgi:hypothetical protein
MSQVTLELVQAKQTELAEMIQALARKAQSTKRRLPATDIVLFPGEWYAGAVLHEDGSIKHHLIVAAVREGCGNFDDTQAWAEALGFTAPTIQEAHLIVANKHKRLAGITCFWTSEKHSQAAYAWHCCLYFGFVSDYYRSAQLGGVAVRRLIP